MTTKRKSKVGSIISKVANKAKDIVSKIISKPLGITGANQAASAIGGISNIGTQNKNNQTETFGGLTYNKKDATTVKNFLASNKGGSVDINKAIKSGGLTIDSAPSDSPYSKYVSGSSTTSNTGSNFSNYESQILNLASTFAGSEAPSNVNNVLGTNTPSYSGGISNNKSTISDITDNKSYLAGQKSESSDLQKMIDAREQQRLKSLEDYTKENKSLIDTIFGQRESKAEIRREEEDRLGVDFRQYLQRKNALQEELSTINDEYTKLEEAKNQQIATITNSPYGTMDFLNNQVAAIERNAAPRLNALATKANLKSAEIAAVNEDWELVDKYIQDAVNAKYADQQDKIDMAKEYMNLNSDVFDRMDSIYKESFDTSIRLAEAKLDFDRQKDLINYRESISGGTSGTNTTQLTGTQQKTYEAYRSQITTYKSKEEAVEELEKVKFSVIKAIGQVGYDMLLNDILNSTLPEKTLSWWDRLLGRE